MADVATRRHDGAHPMAADGEKLSRSEQSRGDIPALPPPTTIAVRARFPTRDACVAAVRAYVTERTEAGGYPGLNGYDRAAPERNWPNSKTVVARLGSWREALLTSGFDAPRRPAETFVTREECMAAVAAYAAEATARGDHPGLVGYERTAASRRWPSRTTVTARLGPWTSALASVGLNRELDRSPDSEECLVALRDYIAEMAGSDCYPGQSRYETTASSRGWPPARIVRARLGGWERALQRAGFADGAKFGSRKLVTREACIDAVRAYVVEAVTAGRHPGVVGYDAVQKERGWPQRQSTVMARLGSWSAALSEAGYGDPIHQRRHRVTRGQCLVAVASYLAEASATNETPTLAGYGKLARARRWPAVATLLARLGSWQEALMRASPSGTSGSRGIERVSGGAGTLPPHRSSAGCDLRQPSSAGML